MQSGVDRIGTRHRGTLASVLALAFFLIPLLATAASRTMTGSLAVFNPSLRYKPIDSGPAVAGHAVGPFAPTTGPQIVGVAGSTTGTFVGRTVTLGAGKLSLRGGFFHDIPQYPNVAQSIGTFMSVQNTMQLRNGGGALAACPGPGCTAGGQGTHISWCPPKVVQASRPAPGTVMNKVGNWDCIRRLEAGFANRPARIRISNAVGAPHFGGTLALLRRQRNNPWLIPLAPSTPLASNAVVARNWRSVSQPIAPGGENFGLQIDSLHRGPLLRARLNTRGAIAQTFGCTNPQGTIGVGKTYAGLPGLSGPFEPITGLGQDCGTQITPDPPVYSWGFRMTTGTITGSAFFPFVRDTTALGTPFAPVIGEVSQIDGFFFTRMGNDAVDGSVRNISLVGGAIALDSRTGFDFFRVSGLRMQLTVPEPAGAAGLMGGVVALAAIASRVVRRPLSASRPCSGAAHTAPATAAGSRNPRESRTPPPPSLRDSSRG